MDMHIRDATEADLPAIVEIYNPSSHVGGIGLSPET